MVDARWLVMIGLCLTVAGSGPSAGAGLARTCQTSSLSALDGPKPIPDPGAVASAVAVPAKGFVADLDVRVRVAHPFDSDLVLELVPPHGHPVALADTVGSWGDDFSGTVFDDESRTSVVSSLPPFTGRLKPLEPLSALDRIRATGEWTLRITDTRGGYAGSLTSWSLDIKTCATAGKPKKTPAGARPVPPLPSGVPAGVEEASGTLITVTTSADAPAPGQTSLRDAIIASNTPPGNYTIRFAPALEESTIALTSELPELSGGNVFIDGDIDGDGRPDVTLSNTGGARFGFKLSSGGNRLHALTLSGFPFGVNFRSTFTTRNTLSGLVLKGIAQVGIAGPAGRLDTRIVGNTFDTTLGAIDLQNVGAAEVVERVTVAGNVIRNAHPSDFEGAAINFGLGNGAGSDGNRLSDAVVAYNLIEGWTGGITVLSGQVGAQRNLVEHVRILANRVDLVADRNSGGALRFAVTVAAGDGATDEVCRTCLPIVYPDQNTVRDVEISGNRLGKAGGVGLSAACCGAAANTIENVRIARNVLTGAGPAPGVAVVAGNTTGAAGRTTSGDRIVGALVVHNSITIRDTGKQAGGAYGGIYLLGGNQSRRGSVQQVRIEYNHVDTRLVGIHVIGGLSMNLPASENALSEISIRRNVVPRKPVRSPWASRRATGITLTGGLGQKARRNRVTCVNAGGNLVAGARDNVAVLKGAPGNAATRRCS